MSWLTAMERRCLAAIEGICLAAIETSSRLTGIWGFGDLGSRSGSAAIEATDLEALLAEVEEEADRSSSRLQVARDLRAVNAGQVVDCLEFNHDSTFDEEVESVRTDFDTRVVNRNEQLSLEAHPPTLQLDLHRGLVHGLQKAGPEFRVHRERRPDNRPGHISVDKLHLSPQSPNPQIPANRPVTPIVGTPRSRFQAGFTLLEVMMALLLLATAVTILVQSQTTAVHLQEQATRINTATMLARQIFTELDIRMAKEGFGELEVKEQGDFNDNIYDGAFDDYRWEYEVEKLEVELPNLGNLMGMLGEGTDELGDAAGVSTGGQAPQSDLAALGALGFDFSFLTEQMGKYLREARVRICWVEGKDRSGQDQEECLEVVTHMANPTGRVLSAEEQLALDNYEDAGGDVDALMDQLNGGGGGGNPGAPLGGLGGR